MVVAIMVRSSLLTTSIYAAITFPKIQSCDKFYFFSFWKVHIKIPNKFQTQNSLSIWTINHLVLPYLTPHLIYCITHIYNKTVSVNLTYIPLVQLCSLCNIPTILDYSLGKIINYYITLKHKDDSDTPIIYCMHVLLDIFSHKLSMHNLEI